MLHRVTDQLSTTDYHIIFLTQFASSNVNDNGIVNGELYLNLINPEQFT